MPYNPGIQYRGDQYLFSGISGAGEEVAKGIERYRNERQESQFLDGAFETLMQTAAPQIQKGRGTPEMLKEFAGFSGQSLGKKRGTVANLAFLINQWNHEEQMEMTRENQRANNERADKFLDIQQRQADASSQARDRQAHFAQLIEQLFQPTPGPAAGGGGMMVPTAQRRQLTPDVIASFMGQSGVATPEGVTSLMKLQNDLTPFNPTPQQFGDETFYPMSRGSGMWGKKQGDKGEWTQQRDLLNLRGRLVNAQANALNPKGAEEARAMIQDIDAMLKRLGGESPDEVAAEPADKPAGTKPAPAKKGERRWQNGFWYKYDGTQWLEEPQ